MGKGQRSRKVELIQLLRDRPNLTAQQIGNALGIHYRSVYRVVDNCVSDGYFIVHEDSKFRLSNEDRDKSIFDFSLTAMQAHDLITAAESVRTLTPHAKEAVEEIRHYLKNGNLERTSAVYYHSYDEVDAPIYRSVIAASQKRHALHLTYQPAQEGKEASRHTFDPFQIVFWNGHYYVVGRSRAYADKPNKGVMNLRLDRISEAKVALEEKEDNEPPAALTFTDPEFDAQAYVEQYFGTFGGVGEPEPIVLHFAAHNARAAAEVQRHPSRSLEPQPDGSLIYRIEVSVSPEIIWWVASWAGVEVLEPEHLREKVRAHCLEIARLNVT